ncbi:5'-3' exoribonuclease 1 [Coccomyxa sp. Obi]|nr:5'-3' exoribonuclease 1 [Coccomyxa sp. Obi]
MGIPKFYRWLSERYPLVNQPIAETNVPEVDNLYLDMNGIIHNCTHGNDPGTKLTETEMIIKVFNYLEKLFQIVQPKKLLFMAIDGVAPRAKMNQQRSRRFKAAKERVEAEKEAERKGEPISGDAFDSNCITPGTPFMERLGAHLRFFIRRKIAEDPTWRGPTIVFSGHDVPGEGEHKIMEYIRLAKRSPGYQPNQRHCMYGLDADLIMLSLVTHEPHFCLLREVVRFGGGGNRGQPAREVLDNPCAEHFILFQIGLVRDYLELEFKSSALPFAFDVERIVDDFVLFCMLIGNDFLPSLPTLDINEGALDKIFAIYKQLLPVMGGYLTDAGQLNAGRLEALLQHLALLELETLEQRAADAEFFEAKQTKRNNRQGNSRAAPLPPAFPEPEEEEFEAEIAAAGLGENPLAPTELLRELEPEVEEPAGPTMMSKEARQLMLSGQGQAGLQAWKDRYYGDKLGINPKDQLARRRVVEHFIQGINWVLEYYYRGVASWTWFYPHHYAPMISDMVNISDFKVEFEYGKPFLPFQQLLSVLPAASCKLLPAPYQELMTNPASSIADFYPTTFAIDMEGKRAEWEGVVLICFIDEQRLLRAEASIPQGSLTADERARNKLGDILIYSHDDSLKDDPAVDGMRSDCASTLPSHFASVTRCNSRLQRSPPPPPLPAGQRGFVPALVPGTRTVLPGYPTLKNLSVTPSLKPVAVEVLGAPSKKDSLVLQVKNKLGAPGAPTVTASMVAPTLLGQRCWVRWPYLQEAIVQGVSDKGQKMDSEHGLVKHSSYKADEWHRATSKIGRDFLVKQGLEVGACDIMLHVRPCEGLMRQLDGTIEKRFSKKELLCPIQATLRRNMAPDPRLDPAVAQSRAAAGELSVGSRALFLGRAHFGCVATVLPDVSRGLSKQAMELQTNGATGLLHVSVQPMNPTAVAAAQRARHLINNTKVLYMPSGQVARKLAISPRTLGKITGNLYVQLGDGTKEDIGLFVKHGSKGLCVPDYVQAKPEEKGWAYSQSLLQVLEQYKKKHFWVFAMMEAAPDNGMDYDVAEALPEATFEGQRKAVQDVKAWLKSLPLSRRPLCKSSSVVAPEGAIRTLQDMMPPGQTRPMPAVELESVSPALLLPPVQARSTVAAALAGGVFELGDRVVSLRAGGDGPPFGLRGTVVGIHEEACEVLFDAEFPGGMDLNGRCRGKCGTILPGDQLFNLSQQQPVAAVGAKVVRRGSGAALDQPDQAPQAASLPSANGTNEAAAEEAAATAQRGAANGVPSVPVPQSLPMPSSGLHFARASRSKEGTPIKQRPKASQPVCPPNSSARGFTLGRGRPQLPPSGPSPAGALAPGATNKFSELATGGSSPSAERSPSDAAGRNLLTALQQASLAEKPPAATAAGSTRPAASPTQDQSGKRLLAALQRPATEPSAAAAPPTKLCNGAADGPSARAANDAPAGSVASPKAGQELLAALLQGRVTGAAKALQQSSAAKAHAPSAPAAQQPSAAAPGAHEAMGRSLLAQLQGQPQAAQKQPPSVVPGIQQGQPAIPAKLQSAGSGAALLQLLQQEPAGPVAANGAPPRMVVGQPVQQPQGYGNRGGSAAPSGQAAPDPGQALLAQLQRGATQLQPPPASAGGAPHPPAIQQRHQAPAPQQLSNAQGLSLLAQLQGSRPAGPSGAAPAPQQRALTAEEQFIVQLQSGAVAMPQPPVPSGPPAAPSFLALLQRGGRGGAGSTAGGLPATRGPAPQHQRQKLNASVPGAPPPESIAAVNSALAGIPVRESRSTASKDPAPAAWKKPASYDATGPKGVSAGTAAATKGSSPSEARGNFDSLWEKLQQQHQLEASAAANTGSPPGQRVPASAPAAPSEADFWKKLQKP